MSRQNPLLTLDQAAAYLAVCKTTLRRWTNDGRLACYRVGPRNERNAFIARDACNVPELRAPMISGLSAA